MMLRGPRQTVTAKDTNRCPRPARASDRADTKATPPKRSRAKRDIQRPYLPPYVDREDIAYRLRVSIGTVDNWIKAGLLPEPIVIFGGIERWRWADIEDALEALNPLANDNGPGAPSENDPFLKAFKHGASADA